MSSFQKKSFTRPEVIEDDSKDGRPPHNEAIRRQYKQVRVIDHNGTNLGVLSSYDAIGKAREVGLDLVMVSDGATPTCKIMDLGKFIFEKRKKEKENKVKSPETHEVRLTLNTQSHDLQIKAKKAVEFLQEGGKVQLQFKVKGRESRFPEKVKEIALQFAELVKPHGNMELKADVYIITPVKS